MKYNEHALVISNIFLAAAFLSTDSSDFFVLITMMIIWLVIHIRHVIEEQK